MESIRDYLCRGTNAVIRAALRRKERVFIQKTNEREIDEYAVCINDIPDFWLDAFKTKKEAVEYCRKHHLPILK